MLSTCTSKFQHVLLICHRCKVSVARLFHEKPVPSQWHRVGTGDAKKNNKQEEWGSGKHSASQHTVKPDRRANDTIAFFAVQTPITCEVIERLMRTL